MRASAVKAVYASVGRESPLRSPAETRSQRLQCFPPVAGTITSAASLIGAPSSAPTAATTPAFTKRAFLLVSADTDGNEQAWRHRGPRMPTWRVSGASPPRRPHVCRRSPPPASAAPFSMSGMGLRAAETGAEERHDVGVVDPVRVAVPGPAGPSHAWFRQADVQASQLDVDPSRGSTGSYIRGRMVASRGRRAEDDGA